MEALFRNEDPGLLRLLGKNTTVLKPAEIRASLKRLPAVRAWQDSLADGTLSIKGKMIEPDYLASSTGIS
jgi:hypothetical protein